MRISLTDDHVAEVACHRGWTDSTSFAWGSFWSANASSCIRRQAHLCVLIETCTEKEYVKLVEALCKEHNINLIKYSDAKKLGEWVGLCKIDKEGNARKVVGCSCVVVKVGEGFGGGLMRVCEAFMSYTQYLWCTVIGLWWRIRSQKHSFRLCEQQVDDHIVQEIILGEQAAWCVFAFLRKRDVVPRRRRDDVRNSLFWIIYEDMFHTTGINIVTSDLRFADKGTLLWDIVFKDGNWWNVFAPLPSHYVTPAIELTYCHSNHHSCSLG